MTMENEEKKNTDGGFHVHVYSSGNNIAQTITQTINGNVYYGRQEEQDEMKEKKELNEEQLARAIENCQQYFWGNSSYAVLFCLCRDDYKKALSQTGFERMVEMLTYEKRRDYRCSPGTIANAFSDNPIYKLHVDEWEKNGAPQRMLLLLDKLRKELKL